MKKIMREMTVEELLKQLMLELVYPAVLGAVLFQTLEFVTTAFSSLDHWCSPGMTFDSLTAVKCVLLLVTIAFYGCDYVYIILTPNLRVKFFLYDCAFLMGLYLTLVCLKVRNASEFGELPVTWAITALYALFFWMYRDWDKDEEADAMAPDEKSFYQKVIRWEGRSLLALLACAPVVWLLRCSVLSSVVLLILLMFVTFAFFTIVRKKRRVAKIMLDVE